MILLSNKKAKFDYEISKTYTAGIVLSGAEVKSLRNKSGSLNGSFVKIIGSEAFLINAQITPYKFADNRDYDPKKTRKLLLKKKEIYQILEATQQKNWTVVPLSVDLVGNRIKLTLGLGKGRKQFEKRAKIKERDEKRKIAKMIKTKQFN